MANAKMYRCANCRESLSQDETNRVNIGKNRWVVFCGGCNCFVSFEDPTIVTHKPVVSPALAVKKPAEAAEKAAE